MDPKLKAKADELEIKTDEDMSDDDVTNLITAKEVELEKLKNTDKTYSEKEFKKAVEARDKAKIEMRKYKERVDALEVKIEKAVDPATVTELKDQLKVLQDFKKEADDKKEEEDLKKLDSTQREKLRFDKKITEMQDQIDAIKDVGKQEKEKYVEKEKSNQSRIEKLRMKTLRADIMEEAIKYDPIKPSQVFRLVKDDFEYDSDMDEFVHTVRDKKGKIIEEIYVAEYVKEYLEDEANENLIKSKVNKNSLNLEKHGNKNKKDGLGRHNPKDPVIVSAADRSNQTPEQYIKRVLIPKDEYNDKKKE